MLSFLVQKYATIKNTRKTYRLREDIKMCLNCGPSVLILHAMLFSAVRVLGLGTTVMAPTIVSLGVVGFGAFLVMRLAAFIMGVALVSSVLRLVSSVVRLALILISFIVGMVSFVLYVVLSARCEQIEKNLQ
jgi:hypothetical protein